MKARLTDSVLRRVVLFPEDPSGQSVSFEFTKNASGRWSPRRPSPAARDDLDGDGVARRRILAETKRVQDFVDNHQFRKAAVSIEVALERRRTNLDRGAPCCRECQYGILTLLRFAAVDEPQPRRMLFHVAVLHVEPHRQIAAKAILEIRED